jgi:DNA-binding GntR family transcriptional regulator
MMTCDDRQPLGITGDVDREGAAMVDLGTLPRRNTVPGHTKIQRLIDDITSKIASGEWPPGYKLPTDAELRKEYEVSQMTIRTAMERLRPLVESAPGVGRFVAEP